MKMTQTSATGPGSEPADQPFVRPLKTTIMLVALYVVVMISYILASGMVAAGLARNVEELRQLETVKGVGFVVVSALALFFGLWRLLTRIWRQEKALLEQRDVLVAAERRAVAGVFASSVAHDINNILMLLRYDVQELLEAEELNPEHKLITLELGPAVEDLAVMSKRLAAAGAKNIPGEFVDVDLVALSRRVMEFARSHAKLRHCTMRVTGEESLIMQANPTIIRLMLLNLLLNAGDITGGEGSIEIHVRREADIAVVEVHDNGPGVPPDKRRQLFTPYYTSKSDGLGLGLVSVRVYAEAHSGTVEVLDSPLGGACFRIRLPVRHSPQPDEKEESLAQAATI